MEWSQNVRRIIWKGLANESGAERSRLYVRQCAIDSETRLDRLDMFGFVVNKGFGMY
jgi:hypothetical protein